MEGESGEESCGAEVSFSLFRLFQTVNLIGNMRGFKIAIIVESAAPPLQD